MFFFVAGKVFFLYRGNPPLSWTCHDDISSMLRQKCQSLRTLKVMFVGRGRAGEDAFGILPKCAVPNKNLKTNWRNIKQRKSDANQELPSTAHPRLYNMMLPSTYYFRKPLPKAFPEIKPAIKFRSIHINSSIDITHPKPLNETTGKTSTLKSLCNEAFDASEASTHGVVNAVCTTVPWQHRWQVWSGSRKWGISWFWGMFLGNGLWIGTFVIMLVRWPVQSYDVWAAVCPLPMRPSIQALWMRTHMFQEKAGLTFRNDAWRRVCW